MARTHARMRERNSAAEKELSVSANVENFGENFFRFPEWERRL
jgi:hypothetical protein